MADPDFPDEAAGGQQSARQLAQPLLSPPPDRIPVEVFAELPPVEIAPMPERDPRPPANPDESLVELKPQGPVFYIDAYARLGILPSRPGRLRSGVVDRLSQAAAKLPPDYSLAVLDAWRSLEVQAALDQFYGPQAVAAGFVAPVDGKYEPPHTTGGAVDLTLAWRGQPLRLGTDFDDFTPLAYTGSFEQAGRDGRIRLLRRALAFVMTESGFVNHQFGHEWWHWSFGDDIWAGFNDCDTLYDIARPG